MEFCDLNSSILDLNAQELTLCALYHRPDNQSTAKSPRTGLTAMYGCHHYHIYMQKTLVIESAPPCEFYTVYQAKRQKHTTGGIPRWSPTLVLVARFSAYVWQSGRDAQFSLTYGRMCSSTVNDRISSLNNKSENRDFSPLIVLHRSPSSLHCCLLLVPSGPEV